VRTITGFAGEVGLEPGEGRRPAVDVEQAARADLDENRVDQVDGIRPVLRQSEVETAGGGEGRGHQEEDDQQEGDIGHRRGRDLCGGAGQFESGSHVIASCRLDRRGRRRVPYLGQRMISRKAAARASRHQAATSASGIGDHRVGCCS
jgi:hypothetical protein